MMLIKTAVVVLFLSPSLLSLYLIPSNGVAFVVFCLAVNRFHQCAIKLGDLSMIMRRANRIQLMLELEYTILKSIENIEMCLDILLFTSEDICCCCWHRGHCLFN